MEERPGLSQREHLRVVDPIYYQVNQTRLTEVTQKSSDNLRLQSNKEAKRKAERAGDVDKSALTSDSSSMSEDMLGDMDPDDYGGGAGKQFAEMWREQQEEEHRRQEQPEDQDEGEEDLEDEEGQPQDEHQGPPEEAEIEPHGSEQEPDSSSSATAPGTVVQPPAQTVPGETARAADSPAPSPQPAPAAAAEPSRRDSPPAVTVPPTGPAPRESRPAAAPAGGGPTTSLLDFSSGFLIAEEAHWDENASPEATPEAAPEEEKVPEEVAVLLELVIQGDSAQAGYRKLTQLLSRFGRHVLQVCVESHAKVYLLPPGEPLIAHPQLAHCGYTDLQGAAYLPQQRLCLVEEACLIQAPHGFHPVLFYFAHCFDHALGGESFASLKSPAVQASYQACLDGAHRFGDLMAAHSPAHYFAQALESYLAENDCFEPLWSRQDLYDFDRSIYEYIEYLLKVKR